MVVFEPEKTEASCDLMLVVQMKSEGAVCKCCSRCKSSGDDQPWNSDGAAKKLKGKVRGHEM